MILVNKKFNLVIVRQFKDTYGLIICVEALINRVKVAFCNVYAPNKEGPPFFQVVKILGKVDGQIILGGLG